MLSTDRCLLRPSVVADYRALVASVESPAFPSELPLAQLHKQAKLKSWFEAMLAMSSDGRASLFSIDAKEGQRCIGQVSLVAFKDCPSWNLAFWLNPSNWGQGLAAEASKVVLSYAFTECDIDSITAGAALWNPRSAQVLAKLGFQPIECDDAALVGQTVPPSMQMFAISKTFWIQSRSAE